MASIWIFFFRGKECNTHQHPLDAPPGGIGRAMMSSLRFSISRFASYMGNSGPHPIWEMLPRGQKKSNRHRNTSCVVFSPQSVSQQSVWALKVRFGKIDVPVHDMHVMIRGAPKTGSSPPTTKIGPRASEQLWTMFTWHI